MGPKKTAKRRLQSTSPIKSCLVSMKLRFGSLLRVTFVDEKASSRVMPLATPPTKSGRSQKRCIYVDDEAEVEEDSNNLNDVPEVTGFHYTTVVDALLVDIRGVDKFALKRIHMFLSPYKADLYSKDGVPCSKVARLIFVDFLNGLLVDALETTPKVKVVERPRILTKEPGHDQQVAHDVDTFRKEMQEVVGLMNNLSVHMMGGGRGQGYGYGRGYGSNEGFAGGRGRGMAGRGDMFQCYNCGEWGHKSPQCDKPKRMGGDMFPLPSQIPSRAHDYGIEIKGEAGPSGLTAEEKGKTKVVNIIQLDKGKDDINAMVMPVGKRTTREQETSDAGPSHKRGKQEKTGTGKEKKKRKHRRHYNTSAFPLGEGQPNYNLRADLVGRKVDVAFGQFMEMCPRLKRQWKRMVNPMKNEPTKGSVRVLSLNELPNICPTIDAWHKWKCIGEAYIDGGAQVT
ncbi:hypothetical protein L7F22_016709 [Adiantum nelumboides]|nr:hypothetical protein [Adiantum nelumboides]